MHYSIQKNTSIGYKVFYKEALEDVIRFFESIEPLNQKELELLENGNEVEKYVYGDTYIVVKENDEIPEERVFDDSYCGIAREELWDCI